VRSGAPGLPAVGGRLAGAAFRFRTDAPDLAAYAGVHLAMLASDEAGPPDVDAILRWHEGQPPEDRLAAFPYLSQMERVDRDIYVTAEEIHWFRVDDLRDLYVHFAWRDGRLRIEGDFFHRLANDPRRDRAKRLLYRKRVPALRQQRFTTLLYYLVYYPCWWWLEYTQDLHPIHAAGIWTDAGVILLAGASGVGKSTLSVALGTLPGAKLLSDSFVLHNKTDVFPVREPLLLDGWSRGWLGSAADELQAIDWRYCLNRTGYCLPPHRLADSGRATLLVLPRRAAAAFTRRMTAEQARQRLSAANLIVNDLRRYWAFAAVIEHIVPGGLVSRREAQLSRLTSEVPCHEVGLTADMASRAAAERIMHLLRGKHLRVIASRQ